MISKGQITYDQIMGWARQHNFDIVKLEKDVQYNSSSTDTPEDRAIGLFRHYLHLCGEAGIRDNPVFWGADAKKYRNINVNDVGVIAAKVDMNQVKDFLGAEEEYRVPPEAILKVLRVWRA